MLVSADALIDDPYGDAPPPSVVATLQAYVSDLRRTVEPERPPRLLIGRPPGYLLATTSVDAVRFTELVSRPESRPAGETLARLEEAPRLWRGNMDLGRPQVVITSLEAEADANPLRERLWHLLALYRTGRQANALAVLRRARNLFADRLGLGPCLELRALEDDILRQADRLLPPPHGVRPGLPVRRVPHGRDRQLADLESLPAHDGLAVAAVSGESGIGKTWLLEALPLEAVSHLPDQLLTGSRCLVQPIRDSLWFRDSPGSSTTSLWFRDSPGLSMVVRRSRDIRISLCEGPPGWRADDHLPANNACRP